MTIYQYVEDIKFILWEYGYDNSTVDCFLCDIIECYNNNMTVEECIDELF